MPTNHSYGMGCSSCSGCMAFGTIRPIALSPLSRISLSGDLPLVSLGPVRVLDARLPTRGIPRLSRSRARPLLALWVQGSRGTASERITTVSPDSIRSQLFFNGTGLSNHRWIVGGKLCLLLNQWGLIVGWACGTANVADNSFQWLIRQVDGRMIVLSDTGFHAAVGDPSNLK